MAHDWTNSEELIRGRSCRPARTAQGWSCDRWRTATGEWFCGVCGLPLPPVQVDLFPPVGNSSPSGAQQREINVVCRRTTDLRNEDLKDFELAVTTTDSAEEDDVVAIPIDASHNEGYVQLGLDQPGGGPPFDVTLTLRHRLNSAQTAALTVGFYDYPKPRITLEPAGNILLPLERAPFDVRLSFEPATARPLEIKLSLPNLRLDLPGTIVEAIGATLLARFEPGVEEWGVIANLQGSSPAHILVQFHGVQFGVSVDGASVERITPADLRVILPGSDLRGLAGRQARVAMVIRNHGGSTAVIEELRWSLRSQNGVEVARAVISEFAGTVLAAQTWLHEELRPVLKDAAGNPLPRGLYTLELQIQYVAVLGSGGDVAKKQATIEVRADSVFGGRVCIDFGTTDTAAAIMLPGNSYFSDKQRGELPRPIELGLIGIADLPSQYFLPTRAALGVDDSSRVVIQYAASAIRGVGKLKHGRVLDRLKWRLGEKVEVPGFPDIAIEDVVTGYLKHVRALIEEHPAVAARVEEIVATRPAKFAAKSQLLIQSFRAAEMNVDLEPFGERVPPLVSESWPPMLLALPLNEDFGGGSNSRLVNSLFSCFPNEKPPPTFSESALEDIPHFLCTFDIGGGSLDISLLRICKVGQGTLITDLATFTDDKFAGESFRDLIVDEIRRLAPDDAPTGSFDGIARENRDAVRQLATEIQNFPRSPLLRMRSVMDSFFTDFLKEHAEERGKILELRDVPIEHEWKSDAAMSKLLQTLFFDEQVRSVASFYRLPLKTESTSYILQFGAGSDGVSLLEKLLLRIILRFMRDYADRIEGYFKKVQARLALEQKRGPVIVLITGRGGLFGPAETLITTCAMAALNVGSESVHRSSGDSAKAVTSWGGVALRDARDVATDLEFVGRGEGYALYGPQARRMAYAKLRRIDDSELWGLPLRELKNSLGMSKLIRAGEDQGEVSDPESLTEIRVRLNEEITRKPSAWIVYDAESNQLEVREIEDARAATVLKLPGNDP
jgi:hypothetical protein